MDPFSLRLSDYVAILIELRKDQETTWIIHLLIIVVYIQDFFFYPKLFGDVRVQKMELWSRKRSNW